MEAALGWFGEIVSALISLVPRIVIVRSTHAGVRFARGHKAVVWGPGLHWVWPAFDEWEVVPIKRQTTKPPIQRLTTSDGKTVVARGLVVYEVVDVEALLCETFDYDDTVNDLTTASVKAVVASNDFKSLLRSQRDVDHQLANRLRKSLRMFGIRVKSVSLVDFAPCIVIAGTPVDQSQHFE